LESREGISLGCPLSPPVGGFFLRDLDSRMAKCSLSYVHFTDDILVLAPTRSKLRGARQGERGIVLVAP
jgi:RNA-directed DNA polymerase